METRCRGNSRNFCHPDNLVPDIFRCPDLISPLAKVQAPVVRDQLPFFIINEITLGIDPVADAAVAVRILIGLLTIFAAGAVLTVADSRLGLGFGLEPVAYLLISLSASLLLLTYLITLIRDQIRAGLSMLALWGITLAGVCIIFYAFG